MHITLTQGEAKVFVKFGEVTKGRKIYRSTYVALDLPSGEHFEHTTLCSPKDRFSRALGRKLTLAKIMPLTPLSKSDRELVWTLVCPDRKSV